jgi:MFS family permease
VRVHNENKSMKWRVLAGGFFSLAFDAMDLSLLAMALQPIMNDLGMSQSKVGLLATATLLGMAVSGILAGWYADNYGRRNALLAGLLSFSVLTMAIAATNSFLEILVLRFLAGLGLGGLWGVISAYITETWPAAQRGRAAAFVLSSWAIGQGTASFLAGKIIPAFGWRALFLCAGIGLIFVAYLYFFVPESETWKAQRDVRRRGADAKQLDNVTVRELFAGGYTKNTILATLVSGMALSAYWGAATWLPTYLVMERGLSMTDVGMFMTVQSVGMFIGYQLMGFIADRFGKKNALIISLLGSATMLVVYAMTQDRTVLLWMGPIYALFLPFAGTMAAYYGELYPTRIRSTGAGFCFNTGRGISAFAPFIVAGIATANSLQTSLMLCAIPFFLGGVLTTLLPPTDTGPVAKTPAPVVAAQS